MYIQFNEMFVKEDERVRLILKKMLFIEIQIIINLHHQTNYHGIECHAGEQLIRQFFLRLLFSQRHQKKLTCVYE